MNEFLNNLHGLWLIPLLIFMFWEWEIYRAAEDAEEEVMAVWAAAITLGLLLAVRFLP